MIRLYRAICSWIEADAEARRAPEPPEPPVVVDGPVASVETDYSTYDRDHTLGFTSSARGVAPGRRVG